MDWSVILAASSDTWTTDSYPWGQEAKYGQTRWHSKCSRGGSGFSGGCCAYMFPWLRRFPDPPQDLSDDAPAATLAQNDGLVFPVFRFEHFHSSIAPEPRNRKSPFRIPSDHDLVVQLRMVGLRRIHGDNSVIRDRWCHGMTLHPQAARVGWVRTPLGGSRNHLFRRGFA